MNFEYSGLRRWAFRWIPGYQRIYRWSLFYEYEMANLTKGHGIWSSKQRLVATDVGCVRSVRHFADAYAFALQKLLSYLQSKAPAKYLDILIPNYREPIVSLARSLTLELSADNPSNSPPLQASGVQPRLARVPSPA